MKKISIITSAAGIALLLATAVPAFAEDNGSGDVSVSGSASATSGEGVHQDGGPRINLPKVRLMASTTAHVEQVHANGDVHGNRATSTEQRMQKAGDKAGQAIDVRIKSLQDLSTRLAGMKLLSADTLASLQASLASEIQTLMTLKAQIANDTSTTTLKADAQSITKANRVFLLVEPKARIASAASRVNAVVTQLQALATKLQTRITAAQATGIDVSASLTAMSDFNAKVADAKTNADAAVSETANLQADNGDKSILATNLAALKDARAKLDVAEKDLKTARADAKTIADAVKGKSDMKVTATTTTETH